MAIKTLLVCVFFSFFTLSASADVKEDIRKLSREKSKLSSKVSSLFRENKLGEDDAYKALEAEAFAASKAFVRSRRDHPALKEAYKASDVAQDQMIKASLAKDKDARKAAMGAYTNSRMELEKIAKGIPELAPIQKKAIEANDAVNVKKKELLMTIPEGKETVDEINTLENKITELRKRL